MNKVILGLILAVCVLGMALVMLNERLGRKPETPQTASVSRAVASGSPQVPDTGSSSTVYAPSVPMHEPGAASEATPAERALDIGNGDAEAALAAPGGNEKTDRVPAARIENETRPDRPAQVAETRPAARPAPAEEKPAPKSATAEAKTAPKPATPEAKTEPTPKRQDAEKTASEKPAKDAKSGGREIKRFVIYARENGATVRIGGGDRIHYTSMTLDNPDRIVLDMDGQWQFPPNPGVPKNEMVSNIRIGKNGDKTRVVIDLKGKPRSVRVLPTKKGDILDIRVDK